jgi:hypothetical protein
VSGYQIVIWAPSSGHLVRQIRRPSVTPHARHLSHFDNRITLVMHGGYDHSS